MLILSYMDKRGGGVSINVRTEAELLRRLKTLRTDAIVRNEMGETVGGIEPADGHDDRRVRWNWWYCADDCKAALMRG